MKTRAACWAIIAAVAFGLFLSCSTETSKGIRLELRLKKGDSRTLESIG